MSSSPHCECHDEPMWWHVDRRRPSGGYWRCSVRERNRADRRYWADPIAGARRIEDSRRSRRISRMENELKELLSAP